MATPPTGRSRRRIRAALLLALCMGLVVAAPAAGKAKRPHSLKGVEFSPASVKAGEKLRVEFEVRHHGSKRRKTKVRVEIGGQVVHRSSWPSSGVTGEVFVLEIGVPVGIAPGAHRVRVCAGKGKAQVCRSARRHLAVTAAQGGGGGPAPPSHGARTLGDPLFPEVGNGGYDVSHYEVAIDWTTPDLFQPGTSTTVAATATQALSQLSLDLEGLTVGAVRVNGAAATFTREAPDACSAPVPPGPCAPTKLVITPATAIPNGSQFTVQVDYTGNPQRHTDPDASNEGWVDTADGAFVVNEPVGAMTWMPVNNHPLDKATYDYEITVPTGKAGIGNGELDGAPVVNGDGTTTWNWSTGDPTSSYLSTSTVGDFDFTESATAGGMPIYDFVHAGFSPAEDILIDAVISRQEEVIDYFTSIYGPYPFGSAGSVVDDADVGYALEVQTKAHYSSATIPPTTFAHEIAHQWFGNSVTLRTWKDIWLNEGWAGWSEWIWDDEANGSPVTPADQFDANFTPGMGGCPGNKWCIPPAEPTAETLFSTFPTYTRPAMMLESLHQILGRTTFLSLAQDWHAQHRHGHGTTAQFIELAKQKSGFVGATLTQLDAFFQQWLYGTTMPTLTADDFP